MVIIPKNIRTGRDTLEYEVPWLVPGAILLLDRLLTKDMRVLEFGSGGSTLFFSKRVGSVISYENVPGWFGKMSRTIREKGISNVDMRFYESRKVSPTGSFGCILIDPFGDVCEWLLQKTIPLLVDPKILVLDNYSHYLFDSFDTKLFLQKYGENYTIKTYDHPNWRGGGTRVYLNKY